MFDLLGEFCGVAVSGISFIFVVFCHARPVHKFKQAKPACELIRAVELAKCSITDREAWRRHAVTCGDGAYVGRHSVHLVPEWTRQVLGPDAKMNFCSESSCEFHILQHVGRVVDAKFPLAEEFDDLLRYFKSRYSFGSRKFLARGVAGRLGKRCLSFGAPRTDNFKVTMYSRNLHLRFLRNYDVYRLLLEVDLEIVYANLYQEALHKYKSKLEKFNTGQSECVRPPRMPSATVAVKTKLCKEIRQVGRTLLDPKVLLFGVGRGDLRDLFVSAYATLTHNFKISALVKVQRQNDMISAMQAAIAGIAHLAGALRMLSTLLWNRKVCPARWSLGRAALRMHVLTFAAHYGWRFVPNVVKLLPGLLVHSEQGYVFQGESIKTSSSRFAEPCPKFHSLEQRREHFRLVRDRDGPAEIWSRSIEALDELVRWLRLELLEVRSRLFLWDVPSAACGGSAEDMSDAAPVVGSRDDAEHANSEGSEDSSSGTSNGSKVSSSGTDDKGRSGDEAGPRDAATPHQPNSRGKVVCELVQETVAGKFEDAEQRAPAQDQTGSEDSSVSGPDSDSGEDGSGHAVCVASPSPFHQHPHFWQRLGSNVTASPHRLHICKQGHRAKVPPAVSSARRQFWEHASRAFLPDVLVRPWQDEAKGTQSDQLASLHCVFQHLADMIFGLRPCDVENYKDPPLELFVSLTWDDFREQYIRLRSQVVPRLLRCPTSSQCWRVHLVIVEFSAVRCMRLPVAWVRFKQQSLEWGEDFSLAFGCASAVGKDVVVAMGGRWRDKITRVEAGKIIGFDRSMPEPSLYKLLMTQSYKEVQDFQIWHVLRLYHRLVMAGATTEALAECVGSMLTGATRSRGQRGALADTLNGVRLRCFGISGGLANRDFLRRCLDIYFRGSPWHFELAADGRRKRNARHPNLMGPSIAVHRHRLALQASIKFPWSGGDLRALLSECGRRQLRAEHHVFATDVASTARAGFALAKLPRLADQRSAWASAAASAQPATFDQTVWERVGAGPGSAT